jgi:hypothetical protein
LGSNVTQAIRIETYLPRFLAARSVAARIEAPPALIRLAPEIMTALIPRICLLVVEVASLMKILDAVSIPPGNLDPRLVDAVDLTSFGHHQTLSPRIHQAASSEHSWDEQGTEDPLAHHAQS